MTSAQIAKRSHKFNSTRTSTFSTAKKVIELEQQVAQTEATLNDKIAEKQKLEAEVTKLSTPTVDSLTNAFYRGLGVDFVKQDGRIFARIKNKEKTCEEIWSLFE
ncbi:hypothetical protein ECANGB1_522 [Enterospora canceri]|uniref:Kinetochore protein Spc24 n=1 Tax=Enterospora canceri TaxID=1081671 RepID=A0A1Y1S476_9MICR|nr:hypothetical protein ECANGB1_522 [Enterospora canceri]